MLPKAQLFGSSPLPKIQLRPLLHPLLPLHASTLGKSLRGALHDGAAIVRVVGHRRGRADQVGAPGGRAAQPGVLVGLFRAAREVGDLAVEYVRVDQAQVVQPEVEHALPRGAALDAHGVRQHHVHEALDGAGRVEVLDFAHVHGGVHGGEGRSHLQRLHASRVDLLLHLHLVAPEVDDGYLLVEDGEVQVGGVEDHGQLSAQSVQRLAHVQAVLAVRVVALVCVVAYMVQDRQGAQHPDLLQKAAFRVRECGELGAYSGRAGSPEGLHTRQNSAED
ncbi:hypothetical protein B484DRAFT_459188 [Ochromonadaceae sp. CCMP2298]|nr:hypothetical protein B484DRAFT_459188 [Ochromonadaceae sp. CCMP2298]|mmetsp:Transcript_9743/g.21664  ORF Transcript_9743/g.21664 Transcript_9743/m.21664 type:complete len:277 (+) Transcript_9743:531-1361(+)